LAGHGIGSAALMDGRKREELEKIRMCGLIRCSDERRIVWIRECIVLIAIHDMILILTLSALSTTS
jgi:hypothetical protein